MPRPTHILPHVRLTLPPEVAQVGARSSSLSRMRNSVDNLSALSRTRLTDDERVAAYHRVHSGYGQTCCDRLNFFGLPGERQTYARLMLDLVIVGELQRFP
jgi:hypothetical protein